MISFHSNRLRRLIPVLALACCLAAQAARAQCPGNYKDAFDAYDAGNFEQALSIFDCLARTYQGNIGNFINRGLCLVRLERLDLALQDWDHALAIYQQKPFVYLQLPPYRELATRKNRPLENFQYPIYVYPQSFCHYLKGEVYTNMGAHDRAITEYDKAIALYPQNRDAFVNRGLLYLLKGDLSQGYSDLRYAADKGHSVARMVLSEHNVPW